MVTQLNGTPSPVMQIRNAWFTCEGTGQPARYVYGALQAGASGFLLKDVEPELLVAGSEPSTGEAMLAPAVTR